MKSPIVMDTVGISLTEKAKYSDLKVLQSNAGFFVGTTYNDEGLELPGSRDSEYFHTFEAADAHLVKLTRGEAMFRDDEMP